jgi:hypothetical protein
MDKNPNTVPFTIIEGGKAELERKRAILFATPEVFNSNEFQSLCETFGLDRYQIVDLIELRFRRRSNSLERSAVLAIIEGDLEKGRHLAEVMKKQHELGIRVI